MKEVLKQYGNQIHVLGEDCEMSLRQSVREGNTEITGILLDSLEAAGHRDTLVKLLLAQDKEGKTARHVAVEGGNADILEKLWECAKKELRKENINKLILTKEFDCLTAWHIAVKFGKA